MKIFDKIAKAMSPGLMDRVQVEELVKEEVQKARAAWPINIDYDPKGEGYRRLTGQNEEQLRRDLMPLSQDMMLEMAYYLYDTSALVKRFVRDIRNFVLGKGVEFEVDNDDDESAKQVLNDFWSDSMNQMDLRLRTRIEFFSLLGEQCWPVSVNPHNGRVWASYVDPVNIDVVMAVRDFPEITAAVKLKGTTGRIGRTLPAIREETNPLQKNYGRLVGECFYFGINKPPNALRGRSDLIHLFDFINAFEEGIFDELDRIKGIKAFIWDVTLEGATDEEIKEFLKNNKTPKSNSVRAHNERVKWQAVAPKLNTSDNKAFFDMMKTFLAWCMNRPDSWFGSGGKAYQTEADLMGEPTFMDLGERQLYVKHMLEHVLKFVLDQAIIHGSIRENKDKPFKITVNMPEMQTKNLKKIVDGMFTLAQSLMIAENQGWITAETAAKVYASVTGQVGLEIDAAEEIKKAAKEADSNITKDYAVREAIINEVAARLEKKMKAENSKLEIVK